MPNGTVGVKSYKVPKPMDLPHVEDIIIRSIATNSKTKHPKH